MNPLLHSALTGGIPERLAYADWLESRGEPLATLLRLVCQKRDIELTASTMGFDDGTKWARKKYGWQPPWSIEAFWEDTRSRINELRPAIEGPLLAAIDAAWLRCHMCDGKGEVDRETGPGDIVQPDMCLRCHSTGRVGKLWRDCHSCNTLDNDRPRDVPPCSVCDGFGTLLEVPCPRCNIGGQWPPKHVRDALATEHGHIADGYIRSPLADLWDYARLTLDPRAAAVRRGDLSGFELAAKK